MSFLKKCNCALVAAGVFVLCAVICYVNGYTLGNWAATTWIVLFFIAFAAGFCLRCRQKEDEADSA